MTERLDFEPQPRDTTLLDVCNHAFDYAMNNKAGFVLSTSEDSLGLVQEQVTYKTPYGTGSEVGIRITRPAVDTAEFLKIAEGTIDEKPQAEIWVHAPRSFLFDLANGEKYFADRGFFRVVVLSDGSYLDIFSIAFSTAENGESSAVSVGSMLRPIPSKTDWIIQEIVSPS